jgi:hypothetical protein
MTYNFVTKETQKSDNTGGNSSPSYDHLFPTLTPSSWQPQRSSRGGNSFDMMDDNKGHELLLTGDTKLVP